MAHRKRTAPPIDIVLTEEELEAIVRDSLGHLRSGVEAPGTGADVPPVPAAAASLLPPGSGGTWNQGVSAPGAVGDAIRMLLEATTLDRARRPRSF